MKICVCVKQVPDTTASIKLQEDKSRIDTSDIQWIISPYDELAIEEALQVRDKYTDSMVTVLSAGPPRAIDSIRMALAMGVDSGIHLEIPEDADSFLTAKALAVGIQQMEMPNLIFTGKEAIDDGASQVSQLLSGFLGFSCVTSVQKITYSNDLITCRRDVGGGSTEIIEAKLPAIVAVQFGLNQPRYATALNIIKAKRSDVSTITMSDLGLSVSDQKLRYKNFELMPPKDNCQFITGDPKNQVEQLVHLLKEEIKVI